MKNSHPLTQPSQNLTDAQLLVHQYSRRFGHSPPMLLGSALPVAEMQQALRSGNPIPGWEEQEIALAEQLAANDQPGNKQAFVSRCGNVEHAASSSGSASIGFSENVLKAIADGVQGAQEGAVQDLAHAMGHHGDQFVNEEGKIDFYSHHSPLFAIQDQGQGIRVAVGELIKELVNSSPEAAECLGYPLYWWSRHSSQITALELTELIQRESYAQLYAMYYGNRDLMQCEYPIAYELFKEIHEKVSAISPTQSKVEGRAAVSAAVQQALRA
jgi:hypothetical protein